MKTLKLALSTTFVSSSLIASSLVAMCALPAFAAAPAPSFQNSGVSSLVILPAAEGRGEGVIKTETRYLEMEYPNQDFLKAVITTTRYSEAQGTEGKVALTMLTNGARRLDKVLWTASLKGNEVGVLNRELIAVTTYGCCAELDTTRLLNVTNGKEVEAAYGNVYEFEVPNTTLLKRYLSLAADSNTPAKAPVAANGKTHVGTFSYFDANHVIARIRVYADIPRGSGVSFDDFKVSSLFAGSKIEVNRETKVTLWDNDGIKNAALAYSGFVFEASLSYSKKKETLRLFIDKDTIDAQASAATQGLYLEVVK